MAVIGPIGTLLLCELSKVVTDVDGSMDVDSDSVFSVFFFSLCVCFLSVLVGWFFVCFFHVFSLRCFFGYPMGGNFFLM